MIAVTVGLLVFAVFTVCGRVLLGKGRWAEAGATAFMTGLLAGLCVYFYLKGQAKGMRPADHVQGQQPDVNTVQREAAC